MVEEPKAVSICNELEESLQGGALVQDLPDDLLAEALAVFDKFFDDPTTPEAIQNRIFSVLKALLPVPLKALRMIYGSLLSAEGAELSAGEWAEAEEIAIRKAVHLCRRDVVDAAIRERGQKVALPAVRMSSRNRARFRSIEQAPDKGGFFWSERTWLNLSLGTFWLGANDLIATGRFPTILVGKESVGQGNTQRDDTRAPTDVDSERVSQRWGRFRRSATGWSFGFVGPWPFALSELGVAVQMPTFPSHVSGEMFDSAILETTARVVPALARWIFPEYEAKLCELVPHLYQRLPRIVAYLKKNLPMAKEKERLEVAASAAELTMQMYDVYWGRRPNIWGSYPQGNLSSFGRKVDKVEDRIQVVGAKEGKHQRRAAEIASSARPTRPLMFAWKRLKYLAPPKEEPKDQKQTRQKIPARESRAEAPDLTVIGRLKIPLKGRNYLVRYHGPHVDDYVLEYDGRQWYSTEQMAQKFRVTVRTIANWARKEVLPAERNQKLRAWSPRDKPLAWPQLLFPKAEIDESGDALVNSHNLASDFSVKQFREAVGLTSTAHEKRVKAIKKGHPRMTVGQRRRLIVMEEKGMTEVELTRWIEEQVRSP